MDLAFGFGRGFEKKIQLLNDGNDCMKPDRSKSPTTRAQAALSETTRLGFCWGSPAKHSVGLLLWGDPRKAKQRRALWRRTMEQAVAGVFWEGLKIAEKKRSASGTCLKSDLYLFRFVLSCLHALFTVELPGTAHHARPGTPLALNTALHRQPNTEIPKEACGNKEPQKKPPVKTRAFRLTKVEAAPF